MDPRTTQSLRLFYALWPDDATRDALTKLQTATAGRKTRYENLHLTLAFLGEQPVTSLPALKEILERIPLGAMTLTLDRVGYFTKSRIAWAGMRMAPDALFDLQRSLMKELMQRHTLADTRSAFRPHVTLARNADAPEDRPFEPIRWHADHACLVESTTEPDGVRYRVLASKKV
jgi:2'-5' RNA ligase